MDIFMNQKKSKEMDINKLNDIYVDSTVNAPEYKTTENFADMLANTTTMSGGIQDCVTKGTVIKVEKDFITVDVGLKSEGRIPRREFGLEEVNIGDIIDIYVDKYENADQIKSTLDRYYSIIDHSISNFDGKKRTFLEKEAYDKLQKVYKEHRLNIKNIAKDIGGIDGYSSKNIDELKVSNYNDYISSLDEHINNHKDDTDFNYNEMIDNYQNIVSSKGTMDQILDDEFFPS